jgi:acyl-CoA thioesterase II
MSNVLELTDLPAALRLERTGEGRYSIRNLGDAETRDVVFGGQLLAQTIVAAASEQPGKHVRSVQMLFARAARIGEPVALTVEAVHSGRAFATEVVTISQRDRPCVRSIVLLDVDDPEVIRHQTQMPNVAGPEDSPPLAMTDKVFPASELRVVDGVDLANPDAPPGEPALHLWTRCPSASEHRVVNQAILGFATVGFLVRTALRPHPGRGGNQVHRDLSTTVLTHAITFHEPLWARDWLLLSHRSPYAGHGRTRGEIEVFTEDGRLVASVSQESMIRPFADHSSADKYHRTVM